jgi:hypothetical protein
MLSSSSVVEGIAYGDLGGQYKDVLTANAMQKTKMLNGRNVEYYNIYFGNYNTHHQRQYNTLMNSHI